jgi:hypothetical protein
MKDGMPDESADRPSGAGFGWIQVAAVIVIVVVFGFVVVRFVKKDVVSHWEVLATCTAPRDAELSRVSATLDTSACSIAPVDVGLPRGWPIVTFALESGGNGEPHIKGLTSDQEGRIVEISYDAPLQLPRATSKERVLAFVEVPPDSLPETPFVVRDASGSTTITSLSAD